MAIQTKKTVSEISCKNSEGQELWIDTAAVLRYFKKYIIECLETDVTPIAFEDFCKSGLIKTI